MTKNKQQKNALLTILCVLALAAFGAAMVWLHYQQLCSPGGGDDPYTSDLGQHLAFAQRGMVYSTVSLLIGPAYNLAGRMGIAVLLAVFHLAAVAVFACGLRAALSDVPRPVRLLVSLVVNLATAVWMPRGGYWYQGTIGGTIYHNTTYIMLAPFALLAMLAFYRVWPTMRGKLDLRAYAVYTVLLTVATSFKASLIFAFAPALLVLLIAAGCVACTLPFVRSRIGFLFTADFAEANTSGGRAGRKLVAMTLLEQRGKATGVGLGMFGGAVAMQNQVIDHQEYFYVDNYYLKLMIEMGYTGLSAFLITVLSFLANGCRALYRTAQQKRQGLSRLFPLCAGIFAGLCGVLVHCGFENIFEEPYMMAYFWSLAGLLMWAGFLRESTQEVRA